MKTAFLYDLLSCTERHHQYVFTKIVLMTFVIITAANIDILLQTANVRGIFLKK